MKIDKNDPRLTAYILNELSNDERVLIEQAMREDVNLKAEVELLKGAVSVLQQQPGESAYRLTPIQREKVLSRKAAGWRWWPAVGGFATAGLALMLVLKNPVSTNSAAQLQQEKTAKLEAVSETKSANAVAETPQIAKPEARTGAPSDTAPVQIAPAAPQRENMAVVDEKDSKSQDGLLAARVEESIDQVDSSGSAKAGLTAQNSMPPAAASNLALGSGAGQAMMARAATPKKMAVSLVHFVLITDDSKPGRPALLETEIQNQVLPIVQKCSLTDTKSDLVVTVRLTLEGARVIKTTLEPSEGSNLSAETLDCIKAAQPPSLQNSAGLREYTYRLKTVSK